MIPYAVTSAPQQVLRDQVSGLRAALRPLLDIEGVADVRFLPRNKRHGRQVRGKVFVVLETSDVERDFYIVSMLCQIDDVDMDLVPLKSEGMIPGDAESLRDSR